MDWKKMLLEKATKWAVGYELYDKVKSLVAFYFTEDGMTGAEKRDAVIDRVKDMAGDAGKFLINLALEVAVYILKPETKGE